MNSDATYILQLYNGFMVSQLMFTATKLNLFTKLSEGPKTAEDISEDLDLVYSEDSRAVIDFLDSLVSLRVLERQGNNRDAVYTNSPLSNEYLNASNPAKYLGGWSAMAETRLYKFWGSLEDALKTGEAQNETKEAGGNLFDVLSKNPSLCDIFANSMTGISTLKFEMFVSAFDFSPYNAVVDIGGSCGTLSYLISKASNCSSITSYDLPGVDVSAEHYLTEVGADRSRVHVKSGSFFDSIPQADLITSSYILHDWNTEKKKIILKNAFESLNDGGAFLDIAHEIDNERRVKTGGLLMSLNMLLETGEKEGFDYSFLDFQGWAKETGFQRTERIPLDETYAVFVAYK
eukprot:TRINITY_DN2844_c0_g1_i1.p1 TRINITY_DN2844_c0_g1~~TRINITY_DN2844_c0_g1_i1.p1  ORF type:complete len:347 (-),score=79.78 TRINITY_DN2844_c0_g1_i1:22-1062(-)